MEPALSPLSIRQFRFPVDYAPVFQLWTNSGPGIHTGTSDTIDEIEKKMDRDPDLFLVAEIDGQIVGSVLGGFDGRRGMIYHLAVREHLRKQGIGASLIDELERRLIAKGCHRYYLLVTMDNYEAINYYEKRGWQKMDLYTFAKDIG